MHKIPTTIRLDDWPTIFILAPFCYFLRWLISLYNGLTLFNNFVLIGSVVVLLIAIVAEAMFVIRWKKRLIMFNIFGQVKGSVSLDREVFWQEIYLDFGKAEELRYDERFHYLFLSNELFVPFPPKEEGLVEQHSVFREIEENGKKQVLLRPDKLYPEDWEEIKKWTEIHMVDPSVLPAGQRTVTKRTEKRDRTDSLLTPPSQGVGN